MGKTTQRRSKHHLWKVCKAVQGRLKHIFVHFLESVQASTNKIEAYLSPPVEDDDGDTHEDAAQGGQGNADGKSHCQRGRSHTIYVWQVCLDVPDASFAINSPADTILCFILFTLYQHD